MARTHITEFELSGMSGICREYVENVGKEKYLFLPSLPSTATTLRCCVPTHSAHGKKTRQPSLAFLRLRSRLFYLRCFVLCPRTAPDHPPLKQLNCLLASAVLIFISCAWKTRVFQAKSFFEVLLIF
jgi:hypothetical protein